MNLQSSSAETKNTLEEINRDYVEENGIHVVRRLSGRRSRLAMILET